MDISDAAYINIVVIYINIVKFLRNKNDKFSGF